MIITLGTTPAVQRSMTFDRLTIDAVNRTATVRQYASGKAVNAARVLHTLGRPTLAMGFAGGLTGQFMLADLKSAGIASDFIPVDPPTRTCVTLIDQSNRQVTELVEESIGLPLAVYDDLLGRFTRAIQSAVGCVISGSLPPGAPADFYARCVKAAEGKFVILDAAGLPLTAALATGPTIVKPNRQELSATVGLPIHSDADIKRAIEHLAGRGPKWVAVTDGANPTVVSDGKKFWSVSSPKVALVSPIGSGDSFAAGLAAGLARGWEVPDATRLAVACGAANALTPDAGHLTTADVDRLLAVIRLDHV